MYKFLSDPGHGWLRVPKAEVVGQDVHVSPYSYHDNDYVYLEEDCDAPNWMRFAEVSADQITVHVTETGPSWVRDLPRFSQDGGRY